MKKDELEVTENDFKIIELKAQIYDLFEAKGTLLIQAQEIDKEILALQQKMGEFQKV